MKLESVGDVIAVRKFRLLGELNPDEPVREVLLKLGKPQPSPDSPVVEEYYCPFQITGAGDERVRYAAGVDAFQAIQLSLRLIGGELSRLKRALNGSLEWEYDDNGGFGFPEYREN